MSYKHDLVQLTKSCHNASICDEEDMEKYFAQSDGNLYWCSNNSYIFWL